MRKFFAEFKKFITRGNVVDMAVGVAVAGAFTKIVNAFTAGFVTPLISLLAKDAALAEGKFVIRPAVYVNEAGETVASTVEGAILQTPEVALLWGNLLQAIIDFLLIALMLFVVMKTFNAVLARAKEIREDVIEEITSRNKEEEEAKAKAEAEEKAKAEAEAAAKAEAEAKAKAERDAAEERAIHAQAETAKLLAEIRDLLANR